MMVVEDFMARRPSCLRRSGDEADAQAEGQEGFSMTATKYSVTGEGPTDNVPRLAELLKDPNAFRGAADDLLRNVGVGPAELARLTLMPSGEQGAVLAALVAPPAKTDPSPAEPEPPPAPAGALSPADSWPLSRQHALRMAAAKRAGE